MDETRSKKTDVVRAVAAQRRFPVKVVAEAPGVSRSNLHARSNGRAKPRRRYHQAQDAAVLPMITALVAAGAAPVNHKHVYSR